MNNFMADRRKYDSSGKNLLLMIVFTIVNLLLLAFNVDIGFAFSAVVPQLVLSYGLAFADIFGATATVLGIAICLIILGVYALCGFMSKKNPGWMAAALVLFSIDSAAVIFMMIAWGEFLPWLIDILFHCWIMFYLIRGTVLGFRLKAAGEFTASLPAAPLQQEASEACDNTDGPSLAQRFNSAPLRELSSSGQVLLEAQEKGMHILLVNRMSTMELAVNEYVYAEYKSLILKSFELKATVNGSEILVSCNVKGLKGTISLYVDGIQRAQTHKMV